jgi:hypothetical protein
MDVARQKARFDWLAEMCGATALAAAVGYAALKMGPSVGLAAPAAMTTAGFAGLALGTLAMRSVRPAPRRLPIGEFAVAKLDSERPEPLLLDTIFEGPLLTGEHSEEEPLLLEEVAEDDHALLLVDALRMAAPDSRVVRLFDHQPMPTPGQLKDRIDRHLAGAPRHPSPPMSPPDASQALYAALDELKRSLR